MLVEEVNMHVYKSSVSLLGTVFALSLAATAGAQSAYSISELPSAGGCWAYTINDAGSVAGGCNATATIWQGGQPSTLGKLPGGTYSLAASINLAGQTVGDSDLGDSRPHLVLYRNGSIVNVDPSAPNSHAVFISGANVIVGNALKGFGTCNSWVAAIYVEDPRKPGSFKRTDLQPAPGGDGNVRCEFATGANQALQVVGLMQNSVFGHLGAFWNNDAKHTLTLLQPYPGDYFTNAYGINDLGQVVGESQSGIDIQNRPVMWSADASHTPVNLPLVAGDNWGSASAINNLGQIVGFSASVVVGPTGIYTYATQHYVLWQNGTVTDLQSLIDPLSGWTITGVLSINDNGQVLGTGTHNGQSTLFVMTPNAQ